MLHDSLGMLVAPHIINKQGPKGKKKKLKDQTYDASSLSLFLLSPILLHVFFY